MLIKSLFVCVRQPFVIMPVIQRLAYWRQSVQNQIVAVCNSSWKAGLTEITEINNHIHAIRHDKLRTTTYALFIYTQI